MGKETNKNDDGSRELSVHMEEYKALRTGIAQRVEFQQRLLNYVVLSAGIAFGLMSRSNSGESKITPWAYLIFAAIFVLFSLWWSNEDVQIIWAATYINHELRPRIQKVIGDREVLGWENFLAQERQKPVRELYVSLAGLAQEFPPLVAAILLWDARPLVYADNSGIWPVTFRQWLFWIIGGLVIVGAIAMRAYTAWLYSKIGVNK